MVSTPPAAEGGFRRRTSLRESLRRVGSRLRQSAGRKCRVATGGEPAGAAAGPTVKRCRLDYARLASVAELSGGEEVERSYEVVRTDNGAEHRYEVIRGKENRAVGQRGAERGEDRVRSPLRPVNVYEVLRLDKPRIGQGKCYDAFERAKEDSSRKPKEIAEIVRNEYEVIRKEKDKNRALSAKKLAEKESEGVEKRVKETPKNDYEVVRKPKSKAKRQSLPDYTEYNKHQLFASAAASYENPLSPQTHKYEVERCGNRVCDNERNLVDEYLDRPENRGTLNPAFEDFTFRSNLTVPVKNILRKPLQEISLDDSFKENCDPNSVTVTTRKRKYSVRFVIDEDVEEVSTGRKFGNVIFDQSKRNPSILKNTKHLQGEESDSTEELIIKNYELLTKGGAINTREESNTSKYVRRRFQDLTPIDIEDQEYSFEEDPRSNTLSLPVVSLYHPPEDRMPSRRKVPPCQKKIKRRGQENPLEIKTSSSDLKVMSILTTDSLNQPSTIRTDRLLKIVQKFGPEVLMAMGEEGGDSVLAQFKKSLEMPKENVVLVENVQEEREKEKALQENPRRGKKRKLVEDIYEPGGGHGHQSQGLGQGLMDVLGRSHSRKKLQHIDIHLHALFAAVEHGHVDKARTILESTDVDVNSVNSDGLTPLDVAALSNNRALTKVLLTFGAHEGSKFGSPEKLLSHLRQLASEAERRVAELGGGGGGADDGPRSAPPYGHAAPPAAAASDKTLALWERRCKGLNKMIMGFEQARPPDMPFTVAVDVTGTDAVTVRYQEPDNTDSPPCTKFRVEWSLEPDFSTCTGFREVTDVKQTEVTVDGLSRGQCYYFRVACGNIRGYSHYRNSQPDCVIPSSWRDVTGREERLPPGALIMWDRLFAEVRTSRPDLKGVGDQGPGETPLGQRRKKTTIKQLFTAASKFQKHLRRGVFLSCLLYHEDRVLVTNEDFLPVIEVDETYPGSIYHDFHWLLKVACTWEDVKWLRQDMEKSLSSSAVHFRIKLLQAAAQMQTALSIQDLGQLYHKPLRDSEGTIVICTVNYAHSPKAVSVLNSRWLPLGKLSKRAPPAPDANIADILMSTIQEQITYHQVSSIRLPRGLYLAYLKMRSCVDLLQVLVPSKSPNVPPHCKIRDNPHVTGEEWQALMTSGCGAVSEHQKVFVEQVAATARRLFTYMEVSTEDAAAHRLYDLEVVQVSGEVSLLMVVPPADSACSVPGQRETLLQRPDLLPLPVQVFEMVHLGTYRHQIVSRYSRLSCIIELDIALAQHSHREAFSSTEVTVARERLARLEALQAQLNSAWKQSRWLLDVLAFARDRIVHSPSTMRHLLALSPKRSRDHLDTHNGLLQPPDPKAVKSRGSWPGPGTGRLLGTVQPELSRSEQHLSNSAGQASPPPLPPPRPEPPTPPQLEAIRLLPSRSEDTLVIGRNSRPHCSVSATTSPLLHSIPQYGSGSLHSLSSDDSAVANHSKSEGEEEGATVPAPAPGILQVYAAYDTGLAAGTSLKLHVSPRTSAREVVDLVVKQLNMAVVLKGKDGPIYPADQLSNFCLVAVIGARERCLRDDFKPLQLQNPWKKGRLYVRQKHDVLAALEHSSRHSAFL